MHAVAIVGGSRAVHGGPDERVCELDPPADLEQPGIHCEVGCSHVEAEDRNRAVEHCRIAQRLRGRSEDEQLGIRREPEKAPDVALLDLACHRHPVGQPEPPGEVQADPGAWQLEQRKRVSVALRNDLVANRGIYRAVRVAQQQRARITVTEPVDAQLREPSEDVVADTRSCRTHDCDALGEQPPGDETQDLGGGVVEPLRNQNAESGVGRGSDRGVGVEARIGRYGAAISERLSPARISASYAPGSASTIDSTASKGARSAPSRWCRPARNPGEL